MSFRHSLQVQSTFGDRTFTQNKDAQTYTAVDDFLTKSTGWIRLRLASTATDQELDLSLYGITSAKVIHVRSSKAINVRLNANNATNIRLEPLANPAYGQILDPNTTQDAVLVMRTTAVTALYLENTSGETADVSVFAAE